MTPKHLFLTKGIGEHRDKLVSFELALRDAGIAQYNLVKVTSILPPGCAIVPKERGLECLSPGEIVYCVMSENSTNEPDRLVVASIGVAIPKEKGKYGYLLERQSLDQPAGDTAAYAEALAAEMLATTYEGVTWDEYRDCVDRIAEITNVTHAARSRGNGVWTTVVAVAVFIPDEE